MKLVSKIRDIVWAVKHPPVTVYLQSLYANDVKVDLFLVIRLP